MNSKCMGIFFEDLNEYRCLYDGFFIKMKTIPKECPNCKREIVHKTENNCRIKKVVVTYVLSDSLGWVEKGRTEDKSEDIDSLKEKIRKWNTLVASGCTPGGSEFHDDPAFCAKYFKQISNSNHNVLKENVKLKRKNQELETEISRLQNEISNLRNQNDVLRINLGEGLV